VETPNIISQLAKITWTTKIIKLVAIAYFYISFDLMISDASPQGVRHASAHFNREWKE